MATQLYSEEIIELTSKIQSSPQGNKPGVLDVGWMHSPSPYNYFRTFYARTVAEPRYHGQVHIMPVNTESQHSLHVPVSGTHWFLAAWYLEPQVAP